MARYKGKNLQGVPEYSGGLPLAATGSFWTSLRRGLVAGLAALIVSLCFGVELDRNGWTASAIALLVGSIGTASAVAYNVYIAIATITGRARFGRLKPIDDLAARSGVPELTFLLAARARGVEPRCIVDGREYYDPGVLRDWTVLLRPAEAPAARNEVLLRPAGSAGSAASASTGGGSGGCAGR